MAWLRIELTESEQRSVECERESHTDAVVRRRLWVLWLLHCGLKREQAAKVMGGRGLECATRHQSLSWRHLGGFANVEAGVPAGQRTGSASGADPAIVGTTAGADDRGGLPADQRPDRCGAWATQVRQFLKGLGLKWQCVRVLPVPPKKTWPNMLLTKPCFWTKK